MVMEKVTWQTCEQCGARVARPPERRVGAGALATRYVPHERRCASVGTRTVYSPPAMKASMTSGRLLFRCSRSANAGLFWLDQSEVLSANRGSLGDRLGLAVKSRISHS